MARRRGLVPLLLGALLAACQATAAPSAPPTPTPTPELRWETFVSERYGYSVEHPAHWEPREKVGVAVFSVLRPFSPGTDIFTTPEDHKFYTRHGLQVAVAEVEPGTTLEDFTRAVHMPCGGPTLNEEIVLDGEPALLRKFSCDSNRPVYLQVSALHDGRGYLLWLMTIQRPFAHERPEYRAIIDSFEFTDATAVVGG
jgi:hypothetical protein